ncbi:hypothetical protein BH20ACT15_BH20ACT15_01550 [soil metagenome]
MLALGLTASEASAGKRATKTAIKAPSPISGAVSSDGPTIFTIQGTAFPGRINVFAGPAGRLTLVSPEGIMAPVTPRGECTQDSTTQVSCLPGYVDAVSGDLRGGADTFTAAPGLPVLIGVSVPGIKSPLRGGGGRDRLAGGALSDDIDGGAGPDTLIGNASSDLLKGGPGRDNLLGGTGTDALFGGGGPDRFDGGPGRDLCSGGGGRDRAVDCFAHKKIP